MLFIAPAVWGVLAFLAVITFKLMWALLTGARHAAPRNPPACDPPAAGTPRPGVSAACPWHHAAAPLRLPYACRSRRLHVQRGQRGRLRQVQKGRAQEAVRAGRQRHDEGHGDVEREEERRTRRGVSEARQLV